MRVCGPNNLGRAVQRIQHCCATLRPSRNKKCVRSCTLAQKFDLNFAQQRATGFANRRNMYHPNNVVSVCKGLK